MTRPATRPDEECATGTQTRGGGGVSGSSLVFSIRGSHLMNSVAARLSGLLLVGLTSFALACGDSGEPDSAGSPVEPELAGSFSCAPSDFSKLPRYPGEPRPTVAEEICAASGPLMSPNDVNSALSKLVKAIRDTDGSGEALLASFITLKWKGLPATADDLEHLLDHIVLAEAGLVGSGAVADKDGDAECLPNDQACAAFGPGWSTVDRIWFSSAIACSALDAATTLDVFGVCQHFESIPSGGFAVPVDLVLCYDESGPSTVAVAKVFEAPDDPLGTNFEGIEHFPSSAAGGPSCPSALTSRTAGPTSGGVGVLAGQKGGAGNGIALQGGVGTKISSFSDWGFVDLESATIQGTIFRSGGGTLSGATVRLFCGLGLTPDMTTTSGTGGVYSFDNGDTHIFQVGESCRVRASKTGFESGFSGSFTVHKGLNDNVNVTLTVDDD